jgi:hypothetical protein
MAMPVIPEARRYTSRKSSRFHPDDDRPAIVTEILTWGVGPDAPELQLPLGSLWP